MILGFKDQFEPFVMDGSKQHTIRAGRRWKKEMRADLYVRPRQKDMRLLFRAPVVLVQTIRIESYECFQRSPLAHTRANHVRGAQRGPQGESLIVTLEGMELDASEARSLFWRDGFREPGVCSQYQALQFWEARLPFEGQLIHWRKTEA